MQWHCRQAGSARGMVAVAQRAVEATRPLSMGLSFSGRTKSNKKGRCVGCEDTPSEREVTVGPARGILMSEEEIPPPPQPVAVSREDASPPRKSKRRERLMARGDSRSN